MDYGSMRKLVASCWYDTYMADAFRKAFGVSTVVVDKPRKKRKRRESHKETRRLMHQRYGALDRV